MRKRGGEVNSLPFRMRAFSFIHGLLTPLLITSATKNSSFAARARLGTGVNNRLTEGRVMYTRKAMASEQSTLPSGGVIYAQSTPCVFT